MRAQDRGDRDLELDAGGCIAGVLSPSRDPERRERDLRAEIRVAGATTALPAPLNSERDRDVQAERRDRGSGAAGAVAKHQCTGNGNRTAIDPAARI
jgi:hypothetical protein